MRGLKHRIFTGVYKRYLLSFSVIVLLVIVIMGTFLYNYYYRTIYNDFSLSNQNYLSSVSNAHEKHLEFMQNVAVQFGISHNLTPFRLDSQAVKSIYLKRQIQMYQVISQVFSQMFILYDIDDYLYNDLTSVHIERFLRESLVIEKDTPHTLYSLLRNPGTLSVLKEQGITGELVNTASEYGKGVLLFFPLYSEKKGTLLFLVNDVYYDSLLSHSQEDSRYIYILHNDAVIVSRGDSSTDFTDFFIEEILLLHNGEELFEFSAGSVKYLAVVELGKNGFKYCTVQSLDIFKEKVSSERWGLVLFCLLLTIPCAILIAVLSKNLYKPVKAISTMLGKKDTCNDFDSIRQGINELVGHNQELSEIVEDSISIRRSELIKGFVKGNFPDRKTFLVESQKLKLILDKQFYAVVLTGSDGSLGEKPMLDILLTQFTPDNVVTGYGLELIAHNQNLFVLFSDTRQEIECFAKRMRNFGKGQDSSLVLGISTIHTDFAQISSAYLEANTAFDNRFLQGDSDILRFEDVASKGRDTPFPQMYMDALKNALRLGEEESMNAVINEIFRHLRSSGQSLFAFRILYNDILSVLVHERVECWP